MSATDVRTAESVASASLREPKITEIAFSVARKTRTDCPSRNSADFNRAKDHSLSQLDPLSAVHLEKTVKPRSISDLQNFIGMFEWGSANDEPLQPSQQPGHNAAMHPQPRADPASPAAISNFGASPTPVIGSTEPTKAGQQLALPICSLPTPPFVGAQARGAGRTKEDDYLRPHAARTVQGHTSGLYRAAEGRARGVRSSGRTATISKSVTPRSAR